ncbi:Aromatic-ring hydroxylase-like protein [Penicillium vulpinum]|uniref:Aromatic-ring hydroxylase-like protein n=1 Tax=Penicillium vulpinum TaxID=29845 RepID=UPI002547D92C|nr:Aromatic-ring hydroxylase-like protein [Penicillium vulpinum]KAJ5971449.1 Aromatic-ring hydroxylase-like protein [Penicillium vulpinum]
MPKRFRVVVIGSSIAVSQLERLILLTRAGLASRNGGLVLSAKGKLGYPFSIITRPQFLRILYENLRDKSKVHVNKKVVSIHTAHSGVSVFTADGGTYYGDLVVGADGVHSITRSEMLRISRTEQLSQANKEMSSKLSSYPSGQSN